MLGRTLVITLGVAVVTTLISAVCTFGHASSVATFTVCAVALAALASVVGHGTDQLGARLGSGATGVLQSALGNLPELFIGAFALRAGLVGVVQGALVGSILANSLLVLGIAFMAGGFRHGTQRFSTETPRLIVLMTLLAVAAVAVPTIVAGSGTPTAAHTKELSVVVSVILLAIFAGSIVYILRGGSMGVTTSHDDTDAHALWPLPLTLGLLALASIGAAFVSDWFVNALQPATHSLGWSEAFTGLVVVAIAGNAVENVVGVQFAMQNRPELALSVILNSSLQIALALIPALVLLSLVLGGATLTLVLSPLLVLGLAMTALLSAFIIYDGESTWIEGAALVGLYAIMAASVWWG